MGLRERIANAWNAFKSRDPTIGPTMYRYESGFATRPDRTPLTPRTERSFVNAFYNRIAIDVAQVDIRHARVNEDKQYRYWMGSTLDDCLHVEANLDQTGRALIQDIVMSMFDEGCCAVVPVDCSVDPLQTESYNILTLRVGKIVAWYPHKVKINLYNDSTGMREDVTLSKEQVAIIENPLYSVMNEPNSTIKRLIRKLNLLDVIDEQTNSQKLNMIIQLPYVIKSEAQKENAARRKADIEDQLMNSKYGIAYTDGTEKIMQLNRPLENNLLEEIKFLQGMVYSQLGLTETVLNGTANEQEMLNYNNRTVAPIVIGICEEFNRKFLSKTARTQGQAIIYYNNPFKLVPVNNIADIADKFTRNEIMSTNEMRSVIGLRPVDNPQADELRNKNINASGNELVNPVNTNDTLASVAQQPDPNAQLNYDQQVENGMAAPEPVAESQVEQNNDEPLFTEADVLDIIKQIFEQGGKE